MAAILITAGKWLAAILAPMAAWMGISWAMTPDTDMTMTYVLLGILAVIAMGLVAIAYRMRK